MGSGSKIPPYAWVIVGMVIGAVIGWTLDDYTRWVAIGTIVGTIVTGALYIFRDDKS